VFKLQDQVVARLANTLGSELVKAEAEKSTHSGNPDAIDLTMRVGGVEFQRLLKQIEGLRETKTTPIPSYTH